MFDNEETSISHKSIKAISFAYNIDITLLSNFISTAIDVKLFETNNDSFWSNSLRVRKQKMLDSYAQKSTAGKKGMETRWSERAENTTSYNTVITPLYQPDNTDITIKLKETKLNQNKRDTSSAKKSSGLFDLFWKQYPKKTGKVNAESEFSKAKITNDNFDDIMFSLDQWKKSKDWIKEDGQFIMQASRWIKEKHWLDEIGQQKGETSATLTRYPPVRQSRAVQANRMAEEQQMAGEPIPFPDFPQGQEE